MTYQFIIISKPMDASHRKFIGKEMFDSCMKVYFREWKFKHPYPEDFKAIVEKVS